MFGATIVVKTKRFGLNGRIRLESAFSGDIAFSIFYLSNNLISNIASHLEIKTK
jgi:hypothetical protein